MERRRQLRLGLALLVAGLLLIALDLVAEIPGWAELLRTGAFVFGAMALTRFVLENRAQD